MKHSHNLSGIFCHMIHQLTLKSYQIRSEKAAGSRKKCKKGKKIPFSLGTLRPSPMLFFIFHQHQQTPIASHETLALLTALCVHVPGKLPVPVYIRNWLCLYACVYQLSCWSVPTESIHSLDLNMMWLFLAIPRKSR